MEEKLSQIGNSAICPVAVVTKGKNILVGLRHYTPDKWKTVSVWTCPGGRCDDGETIEQTLRRETYEEVGIKNFKIIDYIGDVPGAKEGDTVPLFFCKTEDEPTLMEPEKFSEWKWVSFQDFENNLLDNYINPKAREVIIDYLK